MSGPVSGPDARADARRELARHEYRQSGPNPLTRVLHWLNARVDDLLGGGGAGAHALLVLLVIALAVAIVFAARAGRPRRAARNAAALHDPLAATPARDHRRIAAGLAAEGRHAEALREWLRAAVQSIEQRGVLPPRPGRTGAATAHEAGPVLPAAAADLAAAMSAFDAVWFGGRPATAADVVRAQAAADGAARARVVATGAVLDGMAAPW